MNADDFDKGCYKLTRDARAHIKRVYAEAQRDECGRVKGGVAKQLAQQYGVTPERVSQIGTGWRPVSRRGVLSEAVA